MKDVYLKAAKLIYTDLEKDFDNNKEYYCCHAINKALGLGYLDITKESNLFVKTFSIKDLPVRKNSFILSQKFGFNEKMNEDTQNHRVTALLFMHEMTKENK